MAKIMLHSRFPRQCSLAKEFKQLMLVTQEGYGNLYRDRMHDRKIRSDARRFSDGPCCIGKACRRITGLCFCHLKDQGKATVRLILWNSLDIKWMYGTGEITKLLYVGRTGTLPLFLELSPSLQRKALCPSPFHTIAMC